MDDDVIEIKLVETNYAESDGAPSSRIRVCEHCLEDGEIDAQLLETAERIREPYATQLRSLVGRLRVPTYAQWKAACEQYEAHRQQYSHE
jgi:hypothetical protein